MKHHFRCEGRSVRAFLASAFSALAVVVLMADPPSACCGPNPGDQPCDEGGCANTWVCVDRITEQIVGCCGNGNGTASCRRVGGGPQTAWCVQCNAGNSCGNCGGGGEEDCTVTGTCCMDPPCGSPIVVDLAGDGFDLTNVAAGVRFDLKPDGYRERLAWTTAESDDGWLALDRNMNGLVDDGSELFGNFTSQPSSPAPNGFIALAVFDGAAAGGNSDGWIDEKDSVYSQLLLWRDVNHDGLSQPSEFSDLAGAGISGLSVQYRESRRRDRWGNVFRYRARVVSDTIGRRSRWAFDVFLMSEDDRRLRTGLLPSRESVSTLPGRADP